MSEIVINADELESHGLPRYEFTDGLFVLVAAPEHGPVIVEALKCLALSDHGDSGFQASSMLLQMADDPLCPSGEDARRATARLGCDTPSA